MSSQTRPAFLPTGLRMPVLVTLTAALLSGCAHSGPSGGSTDAAQTIDPGYQLSPETQGQGRVAQADLSAPTRTAARIAMAEGNVAGAVVHLSKVYDENPRDRTVAYDLARHMRYVGALSEAEQVLKNHLAVHSGDSLFRLELAKVMIAAGRPAEAVETLTALDAERPEDPAVLQALGVAHDRAGDHVAAQQAYDAAMALDRPSAALLNNAAMSHLLSGDVDKAEALLRQAAIAHGAGPQVRQNLAMVLALKGQEAEARQVARQSGAGPNAEDALAFYAELGARDDVWSRLSN